MNANEMREVLRKNICEVVFTKKDGSERNMACTLMPEILGEPETALLVDHAPSQTRVTVWDTDIDQWRCFKVDTVKSFDIVE